MKASVPLALKDAADLMSSFRDFKKVTFRPQDEIIFQCLDPGIGYTRWRGRIGLRSLCVQEVWTDHEPEGVKTWLLAVERKRED